MSLGIALSNALSGLRVSETSFAVLGQNIANVNNENYSRQKVSQTSQNVGGVIGGGVTIESIERVADDFITNSVVTKIANVSKAEVIKSYYEQTQIYLGQPGSSNSMDSYAQKFFDALNQLSISPERSSLKLSAVNAGKEFADSIQVLASNIEELRFQTDLKIQTNVDNINSELKKIHSLNIAIRSAANIGQSVNSLSDQVYKSLKEISEKIDITYFVKEDGTFSVSAGGGATLVDSNLYQLKYTAASSKGSLVNDLATNALEVYSLDSGGELETVQAVLVTEGIKSEVSTTLKGGEIAGLVQLRDELLPNILSQLDNIAAVARDEINAIHNDGVGFPPPNSLTGTKLIDPTVSERWDGEVMIAVLDPEGRPIESRFPTDGTNGVRMAPLRLDLASLDDGEGAGKPSYQAIIDEINYYYGSSLDRTLITNSANTKQPLLSDVKIASLSNSLTGGAGTFSFDLELSNMLSGYDNTIVVNSATVSSGNATVASPSSFPTSGFEVKSGERLRTSDDLDFDLTITGAGSVTIAINVTVTNTQGETATATLTFTIPEKSTNYRNNRIAAGSVSGDAENESASPIYSYMRAILVDENGVEVEKNSSTGDYTESGYLKLVGYNSDYRVGISELTSEHNGDAETGNNASDRGFSHHLGLNDFFESFDGETEDAAYNFRVRQELIDQPSRLATGKLSTVAQPTDSEDPPRFGYQVANGSNQAIVQLAELSQRNFRFASAGSLPEIDVTFTGYAAEILGFISAETSKAQLDYEQEELIHSAFKEKDSNIRGVSLDEEMANTVIFQQAYSANARVISTTRELFQALIDAF